jgi:hypothetical protein
MFDFDERVLALAEDDARAALELATFSPFQPQSRRVLPSPEVISPIAGASFRRVIA